MFIDSHCHLTFPELSAQLTQIRQAMSDAQVDRALCICTTMEEAPQVLALAGRYDNFWATVGVHPDNEGVSEPDVDALVALAGAPKVVAIGETGLDYYRLGDRTLDQMEWQRQRFRVHIRAARQARLPLVIHTRSAAQDTLALLVHEPEKGLSTGIPLISRQPEPANSLGIVLLQDVSALLVHEPESELSTDIHLISRQPLAFSYLYRCH